MKNEGLGIVNVYARLVGLFMGNAYTNVLAPVWKTFLDLEPEEMKGPYVEPVPNLTPESQEVIRVFLEDALAALQHAKSSVPIDEQAQLFKFGGLAEVESIVNDIKAFLDRPRFRDEPKV